MTGYVPNRLAGSLASAKSNLVGVVVPTLSNIVFTEVINGINSVLDHAGYQSVLGITEYSMQRECELVAAMLSWQPCGMIVAGVEHMPETRTMLRESGVPVVEAMDVDGVPIDMCVGLSHVAAGREMGAYFLARGYRRIGYVGCRLERDIRAQKRLSGFEGALRDAGIRLTARWSSDEAPSPATGAEGLAALLSQPDPVEAVYFSNDDLAIGAALHCLKQEIAVPDRIAIAGFNGLEVGRMLPQVLTTIASPRLLMGQTAAQMILDRVAGGPPVTVCNTGFAFVTGDTA